MRTPGLMSGELFVEMKFFCYVEEIKKNFERKKIKKVN